MCFWAIFYLKSSKVQCSVGRLCRLQHGLNQVNTLAGMSVSCYHSLKAEGLFIYSLMLQILLKSMSLFATLQHKSHARP